MCKSSFATLFYNEPTTLLCFHCVLSAVIRSDEYVCILELEDENVKAQQPSKNIMRMKQMKQCLVFFCIGLKQFNSLLPSVKSS